jgi:hypothetical protein
MTTRTQPQKSYAWVIVLVLAIPPVPACAGAVALSLLGGSSCLAPRGGPVPLVVPDQPLGNP